MERIATLPPTGRKAGPVSGPVFEHAATAGASAFPILSLAYAGFAVASVLLALDPVLWLWRSWVSPAYGSLGYAYGLALAALVWWSLSSGAPTRPASLAPVLMLAMLAAGLRLAGQVLAINTVSALALAVDVYALVRLARLDARPRALSPLWMAGLFLFTLPIEVILQRVVGYPLQLMSAEVSCRFLGLFFSDLSCDGVRLKLMGSDVLVDLPCSGAAGLVLLLGVFTGLNAIYRPRFGTAVLAGFAVLALAVLGNALRISALAVGLAYGAPVMAEPWHSVIGLVTLALSLTPLFFLYRPKAAPLRAGWQGPQLPAPALLVAAVISVLAAVTIVSLKGKPVDVSGTVTQPALPVQLRGTWGAEQPLSQIEAQYFTQYGGQVAKVQYGALGLNIVSTRSPLRHLHAPEVCLRGLGYTVRFMGTRYEGVPTAVYQAEGPDGDLWHVAVTYFNEGGQAAPSIGTVVWMWMRGQGGTWSSLQRITPWDMPEAERAAWEGAALAALDFSNLSSEGIDQ